MAFTTNATINCDSTMSSDIECEFTHHPSSDLRYAVIIQPCKDIMVGCDENVQVHNECVRMVPTEVWQLEFRGFFINFLNAFTGYFSLLCFVTPFVFKFDKMVYVSDCISLFTLLWASLLARLTERRTCANVNQCKVRLVLGNEANLAVMIYSANMSLVYFNFLLQKTTIKSILREVYIYRLYTYVCQFALILFLNVTSKVTHVVSN